MYFYYMTYDFSHNSHSSILTTSNFYSNFQAGSNAETITVRPNVHVQISSKCRTFI